MSVLHEKDLRGSQIKDIAKKMMIAARTAPKARGHDYLTIAMAEGNTIENISKKMTEIGNRINSNTFLRDASNILQAEAIVLLGTKIHDLGLGSQLCGLCGFENCQEKNKHPQIPCAFNTGDLGIAIGSAVSIAADHRVDNRIMWTIGMACKELEILENNTAIIYGIPLSISGKNTFFDRKK